MESIVLHVTSEDETVGFARRLAPELVPGDVVTFEGELGTGKTFFIRALCEALNVPHEAGVSSPSYALVNLYEGGVHPIAHLDLYRLSSADELEALGIRDLLDGERMVFVEWPGQVGGGQEMASVEIALVDRGPTSREITVRAYDQALQARLQRVMLA